MESALDRAIRLGSATVYLTASPTIRAIGPQLTLMLTIGGEIGIGSDRLIATTTIRLPAAVGLWDTDSSDARHCVRTIAERHATQLARVAIGTIVIAAAIRCAFVPLHVGDAANTVYSAGVAAHRVRASPVKAVGRVRRAVTASVATLAETVGATAAAAVTAVLIHLEVVRVGPVA